mmetsp:Transcript_45493/g.98723  ORF Transcript_45493/g.98723 Transcript_45493/m.98723 type:complete len:314 (-) Transcript_45493:1381-2322(-)
MGAPLVPHVALACGGRIDILAFLLVAHATSAWARFPEERVGTMLGEISTLVALPVLVHPSVHALMISAVIRSCPRGSCGSCRRSSGSILHCQPLLDHTRLWQFDDLCQRTLIASSASHGAICLEPILVAKTWECRALPTPVVLRFPPTHTMLVRAGFICGLACVASLPAIQIRSPRPVGARFLARHGPFGNDSSVDRTAVPILVHPVGVIGTEAGCLVASSRSRGGRGCCRRICYHRPLRRGVASRGCVGGTFRGGGGGRGLRCCGGFLRRGGGCVRRGGGSRCCRGNLLLAGDIFKTQLQFRSGILKNCAAG